MTNLTPQQRRAAEALGRRFRPATALQIATLSMQRRVFRMEGQAFLVARPDGFIETAATLRRLLEQEPAHPATPAVEPPPAAPARSQTGEPAVAAAAPEPERGEGGSAPAGRAAVAATPALPRRGADRAGQPSPAGLIDTAWLVSVCLSARPVPVEQLQALIRGTHGAVLRLRGERSGAG